MLGIRHEYFRGIAPAHVQFCAVRKKDITVLDGADFIE